MDMKLIKRTDDRGPVAHAMKALRTALDAAGIRHATEPGVTGKAGKGAILIGECAEPHIRALGVNCGAAAESLAIASVDGAIAVTGRDERGLAYALYELAERVEAEGAAALEKAYDIHETPARPIRGVDRFISHKGDERWWLSENYWREYLERLLSSRFNRLTLLVGFDTGYMSPPYPFFVEVSGYDNVKIEGISYDREAYLAALRMIGRLTHEYGCDFTFAIWQQTPFCPGQDPLVVGFTDDDQLMNYCADGLYALLRAVPEIDTLHFRVNHESGVGTQVSAEDYWLKQIDVIGRLRGEGRDITIELRAKGMTDRMVEHAKELGLKVLVSTKYWCEQAGLPYHMSQMRRYELDRMWNFNHSRRYSYADMLKKPRSHDFIYRCWNNGSTDLFTWGDPDYVRRFVDSMRLGDVEGFEVMVPYAYKGGQQTHNYDGWNLFDDPGYQPPRWEEERYWLFYRLFGRLGYNPDADDSCYMRPMRVRFGDAAPALMEAIAQASRFLPFLIGWHFPEHPQNWYWVELSSGASLFGKNNFNVGFAERDITYQASPGSDEGMFYAIDEYVRLWAEGKEDGRYTPWQVLGTLGMIEKKAMAALEQAEKIGLPDNWEARGVALDIRMLMALLRYHRYKVLAAMNLCAFTELGRKGALPAAAEAMRQAIDAWQSLIDLGKGKYHGRLVFGVGGEVYRDGTWADYLPEMEADLADLRQLIAEHPCERDERLRPITAAIMAPAWMDDLDAAVPAGKDLTVTVRVDESFDLRDGPYLRYRHTNNLEGLFNRVPMAYCGEGIYKAVIPGAYLTPEWDLLVCVEAVAADGSGVRWPGLWSNYDDQPYRIVTVR